MNNSYMLDETSRSEADESQVLENRAEHNSHNSVESLLSLLPILNPLIPLHHSLATYHPTPLTSISELLDFSTFIAQAQKQNIAVAPGNLGRTICPPWMPFPNCSMPQSHLDIALARCLNPSVHSIHPEALYLNQWENNQHKFDSTLQSTSAGRQSISDSKAKNVIIYYEGNEKKSPAHKASFQGKVKRRNRKAKARPKRPLSAYNIFFKDEREKILSEIPDQKIPPKDGDERSGRKSRHGKISFESLAKEIGQRWHSLDSRRVDHYKALAIKDMIRYEKEKEIIQETRGDAKNVSDVTSVVIDDTVQHNDEDSSISSK
jgi:hypothetical protein